MTDDIGQLLQQVQQELGPDRFRELLRATLEAEQRRRDDQLVNDHLDRQAAACSS